MERAMALVAGRPLPDRWEGVARIYLGHEHCERLLPTAAELEELLAALPPGLPRTLCTPYLSPAGIVAATQLMDRFLGEHAGFDEVVVNDWGLLRRMRPWPVRRVLGRLLLRQLRDPRLAPAAGGDPRGVPVTSSGNPAFLDLLAELGFVRLELDVLPDDLAALAARFRLSLHQPRTWISTTRLCPVANIHQRQDSLAAVPRRCGRECLGGAFRLEEPSMGAPLLLDGNTLCFERRGEEAIPDGVDRVVWHGP